MHVENDNLALQRRLGEIQMKITQCEKDARKWKAENPDKDISTAQRTNPELRFELEPSEYREAIEIVRLLRRTNTGPARAGKKVKPKADILSDLV